MPPNTQDFIDGALRGEHLALARIITLIERDSPEVPGILAQLVPHAGRAYHIGVTGPPGAGKSTVVDQITVVLRRGSHLAPFPSSLPLVRERAGIGVSGATVGIIAVDPTSPFTGGAILGDRIRMQRHYADPGVYIRSMATRGSHGGLPGVARRVASVLDAAGKDYVITETVGVGQTELDIMEVADTVVVVLVPEAGDTVQTMKAGLMEIADVFVVNKADREGAERIANEIRATLHLSPKQDWSPPVLLTQAHRGIGITEVVDAIQKHGAFLEISGGLQTKRRQRRASEFFRSVEDKLSAGLRRLMANHPNLQGVLARVERGEIDPYSAATEILRDEDLLHRWFTQMEV